MSEWMKDYKQPGTPGASGVDFGNVIQNWQPVPAHIQKIHDISTQLLAEQDRTKALTAALQQISDMGPMSVDDQRWRIARDTLDALKQKGPASA